MVDEREEGQEEDDVERFRLETTEGMVWRQSTTLFQGMAGRQASRRQAALGSSDRAIVLQGPAAEVALLSRPDRSPPRRSHSPFRGNRSTHTLVIRLGSSK